MGDMRASDYALWPWPLMLDEGERVKVKLGTDDGTLVVYGALEESPTAFDVDGYQCIRFKIARRQAHTVSFTPTGGVKFNIIDSHGDDGPWRGVIWPISLTGWFVADPRRENVWGLHFDDVKAAQDKADRLSMVSGFGPTPSVEEPGM